MMTKALDRSESETDFENEQDKIFIEMPIPRTLSEIGFLQAEKDIREGKQGTGSTLYGIVTGMKSDMSGTGKQINIQCDSRDMRNGLNPWCQVRANSREYWKERKTRTKKKLKK